MSFTRNVKDEVSKIDLDYTSSISQLSAIVQNSDFSSNKIVITTENNSVARRVYSLFRDVFLIYPKIVVRQGYNYNKRFIYILSIDGDVSKIYNKLGVGKDGPFDFVLSDPELFESYFSGLFMMCGSINDPKTARYHLEFNLYNENYAYLLMNKFNEYGLNCRYLKRDKRHVLYIKEAEKISDFLRMMGASKAVLYYEDIRIYRDHKNMINRLNNCEQANVDKIVNTALRQLSDINVIVSNVGLDILGDNEKVVAKYRLKYQDVSLGELASIISLETGNKITKSGLYHRFKKISSLADRIREKKKDES